MIYHQILALERDFFDAIPWVRLLFGEAERGGTKFGWPFFLGGDVQSICVFL